MATKTTKPLNAILPSGSKIGRYTISRKLSAGGFGVVYLALRSDGQAVAIKEFLPSVMNCRGPADKGQVMVRNAPHAKRFKDGLDAFFREADTLARIHNDRVIQIWDVFEANGTAYFAMPVEKGGTLQALIRAQPHPLPDAQLVHVFSQAAMGIESLHEASLLHLDVKPSNLWVRPDGSVVVLDLGASRWDDEEGRIAQLARTPGFAAPEQHGTKRARALTVRTDVYGLGASLYAAIERRPPPPAPQRRPSEPSLLRRRLGQHSAQLLEVVDKAMSLLPGDRYATAKDFRDALRQVPRLASTSHQVRDHLPGARGWENLLEELPALPESIDAVA